MPIGIERIEFNAHRIFDPATIVSEASMNNLTLLKFFYLTASGVQESKSHSEDFKVAISQEYSLGIFLFEREAPLAN